ncbi:GTPase HflX [Myxococcota bacterium]|nr:GTPase HflX [Myxococcota bacterium]
MQDVHGNTKGLKPSQIKALGHFYRRRVRASQVVGPELARNLTELSREVGRQIGLLLDRRGNVSHVVVGDAHKLFLPELGRARAGSGRLRGLRLVHTHVGGEPLSHDDLTDLAKLRLDLVAVVQARPDGLPGLVETAWLLPPREGGAMWARGEPTPIHDLAEDFIDHVEGIEEEMGRVAGARQASDTRDRAILVGIGGHDGGAAERSMEELARLAESAGLRVIDTVIQRRREIDPRTVVGKGKLDELILRSMYLDADLLVFDQDLSPSQVKTVNDATELKVIDRTQLILDIFAQRARSRDGRLQVELAQLKYLLPRLHVMSTAMSRLTGGIGGRGPGETKLEIRSRRARDRIARLEHELADLGRQREQRRRMRASAGLPVVSIVGYTNAGKSTLLNVLTGADVLAEDQLFATLDPTSRRMRFPRERELVITDTVGFIERLPEDLVKAFKATLEELLEADLLLHVVDASDPEAPRHIRVVEGILADLGIADTPRVLVWNKADLVEPARAQELAVQYGGLVVAARERRGLDALLARIEEDLWSEGHRDLQVRSMARASAAARAVGMGPGS